MENINKEFKKYAIKHCGIKENTFDYVTNSVGTPMITEDREIRVVQMSVFDRLMMDRIITVSGVIESYMASIIQAQLMFLDNIDKKDITMHISSGGGSVIDGLSIIDMMNYIKSDVKTVNMGICASMGSVLLSSGAKGKRSSLIHSKVMTHMVSHGNQGNIQDTRINQMEAEKMNYVLFKILAKNCGKKFDEMYEISRNDQWFNSDQALEFGLIDSVIGLDTNKKNSISKLLEGFGDHFDREFKPKV